MSKTEALAQEYALVEQHLAGIGAAVAIYGSARLPENHPYCLLTERLAQRFAEAGLAVLTGGGPGIMAAANKGAQAAGGVSVGVNIVLPHEQQPNPYQNFSLTLNDFSPRKAALIDYAQAYVVLPGGFGTLDELFQTLTLLQTGKLPPRPLVLVGREFWNGLIEWLREQLVGNGLVKAEDCHLLTVSDNEDEIVAAVLNGLAH